MGDIPWNFKILSTYQDFIHIIHFFIRIFIHKKVDKSPLEKFGLLPYGSNFAILRENFAISTF